MNLDNIFFIYQNDYLMVLR